MVTEPDVVVVSSALRLASNEVLDDARPRRLPARVSGDRSTSLALELADEAWNAAGIAPRPERVGSTLSVSKLALEGLLRAMDAGGITAEAWRDFVAPRLAPSHARGPVVTTVAACATGLFSWIRAARLLRNDECDAVIAGAAEGTLHDFVTAGFSAMGVLSRTRPRPFDRRRDGFVPCEGGAAVVLMREQDARAEGLRPLARVRGWHTAASAGHPVATEEGGTAIHSLVTRSLKMSGLAPDDLGYIHLHGTGTRQNDAAEAATLRRLYDARDARVPASSTKGLTGHCLGAAGAVEAVLAVNALRDRVAPPNHGLEEPAEECHSACLIREPEPIERGIALVLSYGFGGHQAALVLEAAA